MKDCYFLTAVRTMAFSMDSNATGARAFLQFEKEASVACKILQDATFVGSVSHTHREAGQVDSFHHKYIFQS